MSPEDLQSFSELLSFKNRAQRDGWQRQARELHRAKYGADPA
jgi:predicted flap endonuclease-1-like 5' DNA nuclease